VGYAQWKREKKKRRGEEVGGANPRTFSGCRREGEEGVASLLIREGREERAFGLLWLKGN